MLSCVVGIQGWCSEYQHVCIVLNGSVLSSSDVYVLVGSQ